jgi:hypothetical protein
MNHKRGRAKNRRAGCLMCKPHKQNNAGGIKLKIGKRGFGKIRADKVSAIDLKDTDCGPDYLENLYLDFIERGDVMDMFAGGWSVIKDKNGVALYIEKETGLPDDARIHISGNTCYPEKDLALQWICEKLNQNTEGDI